MFLNSPHRETPKNVIKKFREKVGFGFGFLVEFFVSLSKWISKAVDGTMGQAPCPPSDPAPSIWLLDNRANKPKAGL
jgi:hypothetical protein